MGLGRGDPALKGSVEGPWGRDRMGQGCTIRGAWTAEGQASGEVLRRLLVWGHLQGHLEGDYGSSWGRGGPWPTLPQRGVIGGRRGSPVRAGEGDLGQGPPCPAQIHCPPPGTEGTPQKLSLPRWVRVGSLSLSVPLGASVPGRGSPTATLQSRTPCSTPTAWHGIGGGHVSSIFWVGTEAQRLRGTTSPSQKEAGAGCEQGTPHQTPRLRLPDPSYPPSGLQAAHCPRVGASAPRQPGEPPRGSG